MRHLATSIVGICGCLYATIAHNWRCNFTRVKAQPPCPSSSSDSSSSSDIGGEYCDLNATLKNLPDWVHPGPGYPKFPSSSLRPPRTVATKRPLSDYLEHPERRTDLESEEDSSAYEEDSSTCEEDSSASHPRKRTKLNFLDDLFAKKEREMARIQYHENRPLEPHEREFHEFDASSPKKGSGAVGAHAQMDWVNYSFGGRIFPYPKIPRRWLIEYTDFVVCYDNGKLAPCWTLEMVDYSNKNAYDDGKMADVSEVEERIPWEFRTADTDYMSRMQQDGFKTEHVAEFYRRVYSGVDPLVCSNLVAQRVDSSYFDDACGDEPDTVWDELRGYIGHLTNLHRNIYVLTGTLYLPEQDCDGKWKVKYGLIGRSGRTKIAIPTHFYKVLLCPNPNGTFRLDCYRFENKPHENLDLQQFCVSRHELESQTGFLIFSQVADCMITASWPDEAYCNRILEKSQTSAAVESLSDYK